MDSFSCVSQTSIKWLRNEGRHCSYCFVLWGKPTPDSPGTTGGNRPRSHREPHRDPRPLTALTPASSWLTTAGPGQPAVARARLGCYRCWGENRANATRTPLSGSPLRLPQITEKQGLEMTSVASCWVAVIHKSFRTEQNTYQRQKRDSDPPWHQRTGTHSPRFLSLARSRLKYFFRVSARLTDGPTMAQK